jgi:DNA repair protein RadB
VYHDSAKDSTCPIGGHLLSHGAKAILMLEKVGTGVRRATLEKHRSIGEGASCLFYITERGIEDRPRPLSADPP